MSNLTNNPPPRRKANRSFELADRTKHSASFDDSLHLRLRSCSNGSTTCPARVSTCHRSSHLLHVRFSIRSSRNHDQPFHSDQGSTFHVPRFPDRKAAICTMTNSTRV